MEPFNKKNKSKSKKNNSQFKNQYSFDEIIFEPHLLLEILQNSLNNQKNFILYIKDTILGLQSAKSNKIISQIFIILPQIIKLLDLPFASLILEENDLLQFLIEIYSSSDEKIKPISSIFEILYGLFDIIDEYLSVNPIDEWRDLLIDFDIINENDEYTSNETLNNIQAMFINLSNLLENWMQYRIMGNNIEEENLQIISKKKICNILMNV